MTLSKNMIPLLENPRILAGMIESQKKYLSPEFYELIRRRDQRWFYSYRVSKRAGRNFTVIGVVVNAFCISGNRGRIAS